MREERVREGLYELVTVIAESLVAGNRRLVFDLSDTKGCGDDLGAVLIETVARYENRDVRIAAYGASSDSRNFLSFSKLASVIGIYDSEEQAIAGVEDR